MAVHLPRILIAGLSGDSGKTIVSLSLLTSLSQRGLTASVFKKGPDYIDAAWLGKAGGSQCRNLDTYLIEPADVVKSFISNSSRSDISIIEGNRGLFDGKDISGTHSSAGLARLLQAPVVLVVDCSKATRTIAAIVKGCIEFEPDVKICGVILNKIAGDRHNKIITESIEKYCNIPVLGALPRLDNDEVILPNRHLGLITPEEFEHYSKFEKIIKDISDNYIDIDSIIRIANDAPPLDVSAPEKTTSKHDVRIGFFKDTVFTFYYPENLEALEANDAELVAVSSLEDSFLPDIDALYIGGGFPETQAQKLADNKSLMGSVKKAAENGMPIYAECGGLIYLSKSLNYNDTVYPMAGVFPLELKMNIKPVGHGYTLLKVDKKNPYYAVGAHIKGHEFHYTGLSDNQVVTSVDNSNSCLEVVTGYGIGNKRDGLIYKNTMACYTHIHALGEKLWAVNVVKAAREYNLDYMKNRSEGHNNVSSPNLKKLKVNFSSQGL